MSPPDPNTHRRIRFAMVGGGPGAFIGPVHRMAAELDGRMKLVAGAFSRDARRSGQAGLTYGLAPDRTYADWREMIAAESERSDGAEVVVIVTPNNLHLPIARAALEAGLHVISEKPATATLAEAVELKRIVARSGRLFGLTYTYTGYPMVREARDIVRRGALGAVRKVVVEYSQGWLAEPIETGGVSRQAAWRTDPIEAGAGGCVGDIGVHAFNLVEYVCGRKVERICADLSSIVPGRRLDDDCNLLMRLEGGAPGVIVASQIAAGERNELRLRVYGELGGLDWSHEAFDRLTLNWLHAPTQVLHAGAAYLGAASLNGARLPVGHPEGLIEAFANIYRDFAAAIRDGALDCATAPGIVDAIRGMAFVEQAVRSSREGSVWLTLDAPTD